MHTNTSFLWWQLMLCDTNASASTFHRRLAQPSPVTTLYTLTFDVKSIGMQFETKIQKRNSKYFQKASLQIVKATTASGRLLFCVNMVLCTFCDVPRPWLKCVKLWLWTKQIIKWRSVTSYIPFSLLLCNHVHSVLCARDFFISFKLWLCVCVNGYPFDRLNEIRLFIRSLELSAEPTQLKAEKIEENKKREKKRERHGVTDKPNG